MLKKVIPVLLVMLLMVLPIGREKAHAASDLTLFTPYTGLSVTPGESLDYTVDVINDGGTIQNVTFDARSFPKDWEYNILANGKSIEQLSIRPGNEQQITVEVNVPLKVKKDAYSFDLVANGNGDTNATLPFLVNVSEQGTFKTEFTTEQPNMEGNADASFSYTATLKNQTADKQLYALSSKAPRGWNVQFKADGNSVTSVTLEPNESKEITVDVTPAKDVKGETYKIPIKASSGSTSSEIELEAVVTGTYALELTTPSGNLSSDVTAGGDQTIELVMKNTGTSDLTDIALKASTPPNWKAEFENDTIPVVEAGGEEKIKVTITAPDDAIAGDYVTTFTAEAPEASSEAAFRVSVKASTLWGFVGVAIILIVIGGLYYIFKKYGRR